MCQRCAHVCATGQYVSVPAPDRWSERVESGRAGRGGATMILPGETEAALRERNHAEGQSGGLLETMNGAQRACPLRSSERLFSDAESRAAKYRSLLVVLAILLVANLGNLPGLFDGGFISRTSLIGRVAITVQVCVAVFAGLRDGSARAAYPARQGATRRALSCVETRIYAASQAGAVTGTRLHWKRLYWQFNRDGSSVLAGPGCPPSGPHRGCRGRVPVPEGWWERPG